MFRAAWKVVALRWKNSKVNFLLHPILKSQIGYFFDPEDMLHLILIPEAS